MLTSRISRQARISGDCPVCLYPLQGRNITKRPCQHMLCTPCYLDGVQLGLKDSSVNADACEQRRNTPCTMTHHGSTLLEHFISSKQLQLMVAPVPAARTKKRGRDSSRPRSVRPSAGSAGDAGAEKRVPKERPKSKQRKVAEAKEREENGGFALQARGQVRREGFFMLVGEARTCLPDALYAAMRAINPSLKLKQGDVRSALAATTSTDPSFSMAKEFATQHGMDLHYEREINNPAALFRRRQGASLAQLQISTAAVQAQTTTMLRTWLLQATLLTTRQVQRSHLSVALIGPPTSKQSRSSSSSPRKQAASSFVQSAQFPCLREHIQMWLQIENHALLAGFSSRR